MYFIPLGVKQNTISTGCFFLNLHWLDHFVFSINNWFDKKWVSAQDVWVNVKIGQTLEQSRHVYLSVHCKSSKVEHHRLAFEQCFWRIHVYFWIHVQYVSPTSNNWTFASPVRWTNEQLMDKNDTIYTNCQSQIKIYLILPVRWEALDKHAIKNRHPFNSSLLQVIWATLWVNLKIEVILCSSFF